MKVDQFARVWVCVYIATIYVFIFSLLGFVTLLFSLSNSLKHKMLLIGKHNNIDVHNTGPAVSNSGKNIAKPFDVTVTKTRKNKIARGKKAKAKLVNENKMRKNKETCLKREATYKSYFDCR